MEALVQVVEGIGFTEGPVWRDGLLYAVSMSRGLVYGVDVDTGEVVRTHETGGGPNALADDGRLLWVAQNGGSTTKSRSDRPVKPGLQTITADGMVSDVLAEGCVAPNDLVVGPDGRIWFTDPVGAEPGSHGKVRTYDPVTGELRTVIDSVQFPNGIAFGLDGTDLLVADSERHEIARFLVSDEGAEPAGTFADTPGASPDGIAVDAEGQLYVAAFLLDEVQIYGPDGELRRRIPTGPGSRPTNLCFAGAELDLLMVTAARGGRVLRVPGTFPGRDPSPWTRRAD